MIKNYLSVFVLLIGFSTFENLAFAQNVDVNITIANQAISGGNYEFDIYLTATANGPLYLGTSDFILTFDDTKFTSPSITAVTPATTYCTFLPNVSAQAAQCQNNYYNELAQSLDGNEIRINLNLPFEPTTTTELNENIAEIDANLLTHRLGRFQISGVNTAVVSEVAIAWKSTGTGLLSQVFNFENTGSFFLEPTIETFDIDVPVSCISTWDGDAGDGLWATASNWSDDVLPTSCSDVIIDNNDDVDLSGLVTTIKSLEIKLSSKLTVGSTGDLTIDGSDAFGIELVNAASELVNNGVVDVLNTLDDGINNHGIVTNNSGATLTITNAGDFGHYNGPRDELINDGTITIIGSTNDGIYNDGTVLNNVSGTLNIIAAGDYGLFISNSDILTNDGAITIDGSVDDGIFNNGIVTNNSGGIITISNSGDFSFSNRPADQFNNSGTLTITGGADDGIINLGTVTNTSSGVIDVTNAGDFGINNGSADILTNEGIITISGTADDGILNNGSLTNTATGQISINLAGGFGFYNRPGDTFTNAGSITIQGSGSTDLDNRGTVTNTGTLAGTGNFKLSGNSLDGIVAPGGLPGKMAYIGSQNFTASNTLEIDVNGTTSEVEHDLVEVATTVTLSGTLAPVFDAGYTAVDGDRIVFLTANTITGTFATISPALPMGWSIDYSISGEAALVYSSTLKPIFSNPAVAEHEKAVEERVEDNIEIYDLSIYPNPIKNGEVLNIKLDENEPATDLILYNQFGQLMKLWEFEGEQSLLSVKLPNVSSGMYLLKINSGEQSVTKRLLID